MWKRIRPLLATSLLTFALETPADAVEIELVSARFGTNAASLGEAVDVMLSGDGRRALVTISADHPSGNGFSSDLFLKKVETGEQMLVSHNLARGRGNGESLPLGISHDGEIVVFESFASDLARGDTNDAGDVFMFFSCSGQVVPVSWTEERGFGDGESSSLGMSPDGRFVVFQSEAENLVTNDANGMADIFLYDRLDGSIRIVTEGMNGMSGAAEFTDELEASVSLDGRFVAFRSTATNLVPLMREIEDGQIFVRDMQLGTNRWLNNTFDYNGGRYGSAPAISTNGNVVAFVSADIYMGPAELQPSTFLYYRVSNPPMYANSTAPEALGAVAIHRIHEFVMTPDGRWIVALAEYQRSRFDGGAWAIEIFDTVNHTNGLANLTRTSGGFPGSIEGLSITDDGRWIYFASDAWQLPEALTNKTQMYRHDLLTQTTTRIPAQTASGPIDVQIPSVSSDGGHIAFLGAPNAPANIQARDSVFAITHLAALARELDILDPRGPAASGNSGSSIPEEPFLRMPPLSLLSADGRIAVFISTAEDLAWRYPGRVSGIFVRDLQTRQTRLVSTTPETGAAINPQLMGMSSDGRRIAWHVGTVWSNNIARPGGLYVYDTRSGENSAGSILPDGSFTRTGNASTARFTADGRFLSFYTDLTNYYVRDLDLGQTASLLLPRVSWWLRHFSATGRYLVLDLSPREAMVHEIATGKTNRVSGMYQGASLDDSVMIFLRAFTDNPSLGALTVCFPESKTTNLVSTNAGMPVLSGDGSTITYADGSSGEKRLHPAIYNVRSGSQRVLRLNGSGPEVSLRRRPALSYDGRFVVLPTEGDSGEDRLYVVDTALDKWTLITGSDGLPVDLISSVPWISADGQTVLFESLSGRVVSRDWNQATDVFVAHLGGALRISPANRLVRVDWDKGEGKRLQYSNALGGPWSTIEQAPDPYYESGVPSRFFRVEQTR